jgi:hypothetical protein
MASKTPNPSAADIAAQLAEQARTLWGEQRAAQLEQTLEQTARMLLELGQSLPDRNVEPGCHP